MFKSYEIGYRRINKPIVFKSMAKYFPDATAFYVKGSGITEDVKACYKSHENEEGMYLPSSQDVWTYRCFFSQEFMKELAALSEKHDFLELLEHLSLHKQNEILLQWHNVLLDGKMWISDSVPEEMVSSFAQELGARYLGLTEDDLCVCALLPDIAVVFMGSYTLYEEVCNTLKEDGLRKKRYARWRERKPGMDNIMMRRHLITLTALGLSFLFVAGVTAEIQTDREKAGFKGPVLTVVENTVGSDQTVVTAYNSKGGEREQIIYSSINYVRRAHTYDPLGRRTKTDHYWAPEDSTPRQTTNYTYDAKGKLKQEITCDNLGCFNKRVYTYDSQERLTEEVLYYPSGDSFKGRLVHSYDPKGHRIKTTIQEAHGPGLGIGDMVQEYDANGKLTKCTTHYTGHKAGDVERKLDFLPYDLITTNKYNSNGDMIEQTTYNTKSGPGDKDDCGYPPCHTTYLYQYDSNGNWTKQKEFSCTPADLYSTRCRKLEGEIQRTITYYETGTR